MKFEFKKHSNPILILGDAPEDLSGLARVGRDIAGLLCQMPQFRVGYLGRGGIGRKAFPWTSYSYPVSGQWGEEYLAGVWDDFSGGEPGIIWSNWDISRLAWFSTAYGLPEPMQKFLGPGRDFLKWGYFPIDSVGPDGNTLGTGIGQALKGFDRVCAASEWGQQRLVQSGRPDADWIPHGLWLDKFKPYTDAKQIVGWDTQGIHVGCVMTNQPRKDWPVAFHAASILKAHYGNKFRFWCQTDMMIGYWNLYALAADYGVGDCLEVTADLTDTQLAVRYSACDTTMLPSAGEGFGFPIAESMACGTACVVTDYAAGQELTGDDCRVPPVYSRVDTQHNLCRAVLSGHGFAAKVIEQIEKSKDGCKYRSEELRDRVGHLDWHKLRSVWERWFLDGLEGRGRIA